MAATAQNGTIHAGDTTDLEITVTDSITGAAKNITGATVKWTLFDTVAGRALLTKQVGSGITLTTPASGILTITLAPTDTREIAPGSYWHECEITDGAGNVSTVTTGTITLNPSRV